MGAERLLARLASSSIVSASGTALSYNAGRVGGYIQNLSTDKLYVKKGTGASTSDFSAILVGDTATDAGNGGVFNVGPYTGVVTLFSSGTVRAVVEEDTN